MSRHHHIKSSYHHPITISSYHYHIIGSCGDEGGRSLPIDSFDFQTSPHPVLSCKVTNIKMMLWQRISRWSLSWSLFHLIMTMPNSDQFSAVPFPMCRPAFMLSAGKMAFRWIFTTNITIRLLLPLPPHPPPSPHLWMDCNQIWTDEGQLKLQIPPPLASLAATQVNMTLLWSILSFQIVSSRQQLCIE